ncbi:hypothetical protein MTO96_041723 [Rhipicephalus appendiculatus]
MCLYLVTREGDEFGLQLEDAVPQGPSTSLALSDLAPNGWQRNPQVSTRRRTGRALQRFYVPQPIYPVRFSRRTTTRRPRYPFRIIDPLLRRGRI